MGVNHLPVSVTVSARVLPEAGSEGRIWTQLISCGRWARESCSGVGKQSKEARQLCDAPVAQTATPEGTQGLWEPVWAPQSYPTCAQI